MKQAERVLFDEAVGDYISNLWEVSDSICSPEAILFKRRKTKESVLVIANTPKYIVLSSQDIESLFNQFSPIVQNLVNLSGYHLCITGHNFAGQMAKELAQQWKVEWITFQTPMEERHISRDYFDENMSNKYVNSVGMLKVLQVLTDNDFKNFHAHTFDSDITVDCLRQAAEERQIVLDNIQSHDHNDHDKGEPLLEIDVGEAAMRNNEVRAVNQQGNFFEDVFGPSNLNIGAPHIAENNDVLPDYAPPNDINFHEMKPPEVTVSIPDCNGISGVVTTTYTDANLHPNQLHCKEQSAFEYLADIGATYERDVIHQRGVDGQDISRTPADSKYTTLPKTHNPSPTDAGLSAHEKMATTVLNVKPDEAVVRIKQQTIVVTRKKMWYGRVKTMAETSRRGLREERATTVKSDIVVNNTQVSEYVTTAKEEFVQLDHVDVNGNVMETGRGRTTSEKTLYGRQDGKPYDTYSSTTTNTDGTKVVKKEVDMLHSDVKQTTYDASDKLQKTLEVQNMHGFSTTKSIGPNTRNQTTNKIGLVTENVREQQVVTQNENYMDQRKSTETDHSTGKSTTTTSDRAEKRNAIGIEIAQNTVSTSSRTKGILTKKTIVKTKETRHYTKNDNKITYTDDQFKHVVIQEAPLEGAKGLFVNERVKTTKYADGTEVVKLTQSLNLAAQQGLAVATAELLDKTIDMISLFKKGKLDKTTVATSMANVLTNVGEGYFAGHAANLLTTLESNLDALSLSLGTVVGASLLRFGINWFASKSKDKEDQSNGKLSKKVSFLIDVSGAIARSGLYFVMVGAELACKTPILFGSSQIISAGQQVVTALLSQKMSVKQAFASVAPRVGITLVATLVSVAVNKGLAFLLGGAVLGSTFAFSVLSVVIPTIVFWLTSKLLTNYWSKSEEKMVLNQLLQKYGLTTDDDFSTIKKEYRRLCLEKHPDKEGGSKEAFQELNADFDKITALHLLRGAPKDAKKMSVFQTAYFKLRQVITYFRSKGIDEDKIDSCFMRLDYEIEQATASAKLDFFAELSAEFNGLQEYEQKFLEKGYDNLAHLLQVVDDDTEFKKLCKVCAIKEGHASQLRFSLRKMKNARAEPLNVND